MTQKIFVVMMLMLTVVFAGDYENLFEGETVKPLTFSVMDSKNDAKNPNADVTTNFHLTLFSGRVKNVLGLQLGLIANQVKNDFVGYDGTGIYSKINGNYAGYQTVGIIASVNGAFTGIQESGIYSFVGQDMLGIQTSGIINKVTGNLTGAQFSGIVNEAKNVTGAQFSGIVNKADHVKGVQIGLVNKSKKLDGIAIGLINVSEEGSVHLTGWAGGASDYQAGIKFAPNDYWYTILSVGDIQDFDEVGSNHTVHSYMGLQYPVLPKFYVAADIGSGIALPYNIDRWENENDIWGIFEARVSIRWELFKRLSVYGGVSHAYFGHGDDEKFDNFEEVERTRPFLGIQF